MDIIQAIQQRRSIREFTKKRIPANVLKTILECGLQAPSSKNSNPWFFVVTKGKTKNQIATWIEENAKSRLVRGPTDARTGKMAEGAFDSTAESVTTIRSAFAYIIVFNRGPLSGGKDEVINNPRGGRSLYTYMGEIIGIGASVQNILLAAKSFGLGAVYMADSYPARDAVQKALNTKAEMVGSIAVGYPAYSPKPRKIEKHLVTTWETAKKKGIRLDNFTATRF